MKSLKEHILEGILDIEDNINIDMTEDAVECFLKNNYKILSSYTIKITKDGFIVDVKGSIMVKNKDIVSLTNGIFKFGSVGGDFMCSFCKSLTSLEDAPEKVGGHFCCNDCKSLISLKGAPKEVGEDFNCRHCSTKFKIEDVEKYTNVKGQILV